MAFQSVALAFLLSFLAGSGTVVGGLLVVFLTKGKEPSKMHIGIMQGIAAGVMSFMSLLNLIPEAEESIGLAKTRISFFVGVGLMMLLEKLFPEDEDSWLGNQLYQMLLSRDTRPPSPTPQSQHRMGLERVAILSWIGLACHNLPEGAAVFMSTLKDVTLGIPLATAMFLHNCPEGLVVGSTLMAATNDPYHVVKSCFINGLMEPSGVLLTWLLFGSFLSEGAVNISLGIVAGVMTGLSIMELLPVSIEYCGKRIAAQSFFGGMLLSAMLIETMRSYLQGL